MFKIATWNVNSIKIRLPHVLQWLETHQPSILALQELKLPTELFPLNEFKERGYHALVNGQKTYNGVAILSREPLETDILLNIPSFEDAQRRVLAVTVGDIRVINLYIPNGEGLLSEKFQYKLKWLASLKEFLKNELSKYPKMIILGDFNIAPEEIDVYDPKNLAGQVLFSPLERTIFQEILASGFVDCFRLREQPDKSFSWWDYRLNAFKRNRGLRIDHILASKALIEGCTNCYIDLAPRGWERPSDHAPVIAEFAVLT